MLMINTIISPVTSSSQSQPLSLEAIKQEKILDKAKEFEAVFIAESLKFAHIGMPKGEEGSDTLITDTFDGFMGRALADNIMSQGGFGLAEQIAKSLLLKI